MFFCLFVRAKHASFPADCLILFSSDYWYQSFQHISQVMHPDITIRSRILVKRIILYRQISLRVWRTLIPEVTSIRRLPPSEKQFTPRRVSSCTRCRSVSLAAIAEDSRLQPPVGVRAVSQSP